jgi:hypothetical protein
MQGILYHCHRVELEIDLCRMSIDLNLSWYEHSIEQKRDVPIEQKEIENMNKFRFLQGHKDIQDRMKVMHHVLARCIEMWSLVSK